MRMAVEIGVLVVAAWPGVRFLSIPSVWREFVGVAMVVVGLLVVYCGVITAAAMYVPWLVTVLAVAAGVGLIVERWRARRSYGRRRGLPPGRLSLVPRRPLVDDRFYLNRAREHGPIYKVSMFIQPMVCVLGARLGAELLRSHADSLRAPPMRFNRFVPGGLLRYMEGADHRVYKKIFQAVLSSAVIRENEPVFTQMVHQAFAASAADCADDPAGVRPKELIHGMLTAAFAQLFYGVADDTDDYRQLCALYEHLDIRKKSLVSPERDRRALDRLMTMIRDRGRAYREMIEQAQDPPRCFLSALAREHPDALDDGTVLANLVYIFHVGRQDLTGLLVWVLKLMTEHPEWLQRLRTSLDGEAPEKSDALATAIVRETLRMEQSEFIYRRALRDIRFHDHLIPAGWLIRVLIREGHRDPDDFPDPDRFDPGRFLDGDIPASAFAPFGLGAHACMGAVLSETFGRIVVIELARCFELRVVGDGPRAFNKGHWEPGRMFRVALRESQDKTSLVNPDDSPQRHRDTENSLSS